MSTALSLQGNQLLPLHLPHRFQLSLVGPPSRNDWPRARVQSVPATPFPRLLARPARTGHSPIAHHDPCGSAVEGAIHLILFIRKSYPPGDYPSSRYSQSRPPHWRSAPSPTRRAPVASLPCCPPVPRPTRPLTHPTRSHPAPLARTVQGRAAVSASFAQVPPSRPGRLHPQDRRLGRRPVERC